MDIDLKALRLGILTTCWGISDDARAFVPDARQSQLDFEFPADLFEPQLEERKRPCLERFFVDARKRQMQMFMARAPVNVNGDRSGLPGKSERSFDAANDDLPLGPHEGFTLGVANLNMHEGLAATGGRRHEIDCSECLHHVTGSETAKLP
jgi:hypothetical protein